MIEGGGLGAVAPTEVGPSDIQFSNGVIDLLAEDEADAVATTKKLLGFFQGRVSVHKCGDQRLLRHVIPEDRKRAYDMREAIGLIADTGSVLEMRAGYGVGMITAFIRIEGRPFGLIANNPAHLGGAIDAEAAEKAGRFLQLCDAFNVPVVSLCDTPGFMVGPEDEKNATVRRASSMLVTGASLSVPVFMICLRKGYGLGAQAMAMGSFHVPQFCIAWPTGEFGPMGLEGAVTLGYRRELDAVEDPVEKKALYDRLLGEYYQQGKAIRVAQTLEIDAVIDPAETRGWILSGLASVRLRPPLSGRKRPFVDTW